MADALPWRTAWITGASTGIGREVAVQLARRGVRVIAAARSAEKLRQLASLQMNIEALELDVSDRPAVAAAFALLLARLGPPDLVILNAGIWQPMGAADYDAGKAAQSMAVNYVGIANCLEALLPAMTTRGTGHIALVSSVAGLRGLPKSAAYSPTKAALINLAECLEADLAGFGIKTSLVNPGFVETPMTSVNKFPMPFMIKADDAASRIIAGLAKGKYEITFPWQLAGFMKMARLAPNWLFLWYVRRFIMPGAAKGNDPNS
jgi:short-subunit dehydrogenase